VRERMSVAKPRQAVAFASHTAVGGLIATSRRLLCHSDERVFVVWSKCKATACHARGVPGRSRTPKRAARAGMEAALARTDGGPSDSCPIQSAPLSQSPSQTATRSDAKMSNLQSALRAPIWLGQLCVPPEGCPVDTRIRSATLPECQSHTHPEGVQDMSAASRQ
jgi:hypothetical protein